MKRRLFSWAAFESVCYFLVVGTVITRLRKASQGKGFIGLLERLQCLWCRRRGGGPCIGNSHLPTWGTGGSPGGRATQSGQEVGLGSKTHGSPPPVTHCSSEAPLLKVPQLSKDGTPGGNQEFEHTSLVHFQSTVAFHRESVDLVWVVSLLSPCH